MRGIGTVGWGLVLLSVGGCAWLSSESTGNNGGLAYYLPMKHVEVVYEKKVSLELPAASAAYNKARQDLAAARAKHATLKAEIQQLELILAEYIKASIAASEKAYRDAVIDKAKKSAELVSAASDIATAQTALQKAETDLRSAEVTQGTQNKCVESLQIKVLEAVADSEYRYVLHSRHLPTRTESAKLVTTTAGLLSSVDAEATDQLDVAIVDLARAAAGIRGRASVADRAVEENGCTEAKLSQVLNPIDRNAWSSVSTDIQTVGATNIAIDLPTSISSSPRTKVSGIAYRRDLPLLLEVTRDGTTIEQLIIEVPNHSPTESYAVSVGVFGKTDLDIKFNKGVLVEANETKTSEIASVAKLPFAALNAFGEAISEVIQIRIDQTSRASELSAKELELVEANEALLEAQQRLVDEAENE